MFDFLKKDKYRVREFTDGDTSYHKRFKSKQSAERELDRLLSIWRSHNNYKPYPSISKYTYHFQKNGDTLAISSLELIEL